MPDFYTLHYYFVLRAVLHSTPRLKKYLTRCKHCGIYFLTDPRNAGRDDLGCPFGCREANRKERAKERCNEYYKSDAGKEKKKKLNERRHKFGSPKNPPSSPAEKTFHKIGNNSIPGMIIDYLQIVISLIEDRYFSHEEILSMLLKKVRQRSMVKQKKVEYAVNYLKRKPP